IPARREQNVIFVIQRESGARASLSHEIVFACDSHRLCIHNCDLAFVFHVDIDLPLAVARSLLRLSAKIDGTEDGSISRVNDGVVRSKMTEHMETSVERIEEKAVGRPVHLNLLDNSQCFRIEQGYGLAARNAMPRFRIDCNTMRAHHRN